MNDLLDADCTITKLCSLQIINNRSWKTQQGMDIQVDYSILFDNPNNKGDVRLQILKRAGNYYVPRSIINILAVRHRFDPSNIFTECAVA